MSKTLCFVLTAIAVTVHTPVAADIDLLAAIRAGDGAEIRRLLGAGADPNVKDDTGATALMHAAVYASASEMRLLLDAGADPNIANAFGATALMWAAAETAKVQLLLDRGANVAARAVDRTTPLIVAARRGNLETMELLIARGASPTATASDSANLLRIAYTTGTPGVRRLLAQHGVNLKKSSADLNAPLVAANLFNHDLVAQLLEAGADPNQQMNVATLNLPTLGLAAIAGDLTTARLLVERGARADAAGTRGWTPLMMASAALKPDADVVRFLLDKGANVHARDDAGRNALDWALLQGDTPVAALLKKAGATPTAPTAAPPPARTPRHAREAIQKALAQLQPASPVFYEHTKCISCHHQSLPSLAVTLASARGVPVDPALAKHPSEATIAMWKGSREQFLLGNPAFGGFLVNVSYGMVAMAEEHVAPNAVTDAAALLLASLQRPDGAWNLPVGNSGGGLRPPLGAGNPILLTTLAARALARYMPPGRQAEQKAAIDRARTYIVSAKTIDTQDEAFKLLGLVWTGAPAAEIVAQQRRLLALQRQDGGWAQLPTMAPDAYATGQALYALHSSGMRSTDGAVSKGAAFLLRSQLDDGTWYVRSRGFGFQPYFETGFPHGRDQFISAAATAWAAIALAVTL